MKVKAYIHVSQNSWETKPTISIFASDVTNSLDEYELLEIREIDVDLPENYSAQAFKLRQLAKQKEKAIENFHLTIAKIEDEIKKYQCLEMTS